MAKRRKKARKGKARRSRKAKGHVPLKILEKRLGRLARIVKTRHGKMPSAL